MKSLEILLLGVLLAYPVMAWADFTADQVLTAIEEGRRHTVQSKVFSQGEKTRIDVQIPGRESIRIARKDKKPAVVWTLFPDQRSYIEIEEKKQEPQKEFLGIETLEGHLCNKYRVSLTGPQGRYSGLQWEAIDLDNMPIRQEYQKKDQVLLIELKNINVTRLDDELFEIPPGYRKLQTAQPH
jgi:hypothetical protein